MARSFFFCLWKWTGTGRYTKWPDMFSSASSPGSCEPLRERGLHLDGNREGKMLISAQLSAYLRHTQAAA